MYKEKLKEESMPKKYVPKGGNGGARPGAGRYAGVPSKVTQAAIMDATKRGPLGHFLLLEWAQTGVMRQAVTDHYIRRVPLASERKLKPDAPEPPRRYRERVLERVLRDQAGKIVYEDIVLSPMDRMYCAAQCANYFAPKLKEQEKEQDADPDFETKRRAAEMLRIFRTPLPAITTPTAAGSDKLN